MPPRIGPKNPVHVYLTAWREKYGVTLEALGGRFDPPVDKGTVSRWETARRAPSIDVLAAYAEALDPELHWTAFARLPPDDAPKDELAAMADQLQATAEKLRRRQ